MKGPLITSVIMRRGGGGSAGGVWNNLDWEPRVFFNLGCHIDEDVRCKAAQERTYETPEDMAPQQVLQYNGQTDLEKTTQEI